MIKHHQPKHMSQACSLPIVPSHYTRNKAAEAAVNYDACIDRGARGSPSLSAVAVMYCVFSVVAHFLHECFLLRRSCRAFGRQPLMDLALIIILKPAQIHHFMFLMGDGVEQLVCDSKRHVHDISVWLYVEYCKLI